MFSTGFFCVSHTYTNKFNASAINHREKRRVNDQKMRDNLWLLHARRVDAAAEDEKNLLLVAAYKNILRKFSTLESVSICVLLSKISI